MKDTGTKQKKKRVRDMRRVRTISPMSIIVPYIMKNRIGSQNLVRDSVNTVKLDEYVKKMREENMPNLTLMHVLIAAYVRLVSERPALNRFIRGQRIFTRRPIEISLVIKKEMALESDDTVVKIILAPESTIEDVYRELNRVVEEYRAQPGGDFDKTARCLSYIPGLVLKFTIWLLNLLDYFGLIPKFLTKVSPFHCSFFLTSMGSLGIPPIFHHLYDFGTCPVFMSFGAKQRRYELDENGEVFKHQYIDLTFVTDERICDGFYFASSLRRYKSILKNPWQLDDPPEQVIEDID